MMATLHLALDVDETGKRKLVCARVLEPAVKDVTIDDRVDVAGDARTPKRQVRIRIGDTMCPACGQRGHEWTVDEVEAQIRRATAEELDAVDDQDAALLQYNGTPWKEIRAEVDKGKRTKLEAAAAAGETADELRARIRALDDDELHAGLSARAIKRKLR